MPITVQYETLLKRAAGAASDVVDRKESCNLQDVIRELAERRGESLSSLLLDSDGEVRPSVLIFIGERQVSPSDSHSLQDGDVVTLMAPISGG